MNWWNDKSDWPQWEPADTLPDALIDDVQMSLWQLFVSARGWRICRRLPSVVFIHVMSGWRLVIDHLCLDGEGVQDLKALYFCQFHAFCQFTQEIRTQKSPELLTLYSWQNDLNCVIDNFDGVWLHMMFEFWCDLRSLLSESCPEFVCEIVKITIHGFVNLNILCNSGTITNSGQKKSN